MSSNPVQYGKVKASYFWDDGSGINGDTGAPASGEPMQKGLAASPSWPLGTEGYVVYNGKKAEFFVGDRGPGAPAEGCNVLLDLDGKTFAELTGQSWNTNSLTVSGGNGHIDVEYYITSWGDGHGTPGAPQPMSGSETCDNAVSPIPASAKKDDEAEKKKREAEKKKKAEAKKKREAEKKKAEAAKKKAEAKEQAELAQRKAEKVDQQSKSDEQAHTAFETGTAANDLSGATLAGNDLPMAAGVLTLALLPALAVAFLAKRNRPLGQHASAKDGEDAENDTAFSWDSLRNMNWQSLRSVDVKTLRTTDGWRNLVAELRRK
ncbi:hypothetical protein [Nocardiopsis gilva]|uniref:hypothetical protein n=1 Tax=Nocardiopsis gilva TaxID=280236 RepID=UPI001E548D74|nr:hypothetical protein [Nocardiopsis gilva]